MRVGRNHGKARLAGQQGAAEERDISFAWLSTHAPVQKALERNYALNVEIGRHGKDESASSPGRKLRLAFVAGEILWKRLMNPRRVYYEADLDRFL